jgi:hypothetical protein
MKSSRDKNHRRWTLMLIGDHGKVIELKHIRWLIVGTVLLLSGAFLAAALLFLANQKLSGANDNLRRSLETSRAQVKKVGQQTELLMAQLALAEARAKDPSRQEISPPPDIPDPVDMTGADAQPSVKEEAPGQVADKSSPQSAQQSAVKPKPEAARGPQSGAEKKPESAVAAKPAPAPPGSGAAGEVVMVEIDGLKLSRPPGSGTVKLEFKVRNVSPAGQRIEGRVLAILKGDNLPPDRWIPIPSVKLVDGRPAEVRGHRFAINNWRTMRMQSSFSGDLEPFNLVEIYVYAMDGKIWLRELEPVKAR